MDPSQEDDQQNSMDLQAMMQALRMPGGGGGQDSSGEEELTTGQMRDPEHGMTGHSTGLGAILGTAAEQNQHGKDFFENMYGGKGMLKQVMGNAGAPSSKGPGAGQGGGDGGGGGGGGGGLGGLMGGGSGADVGDFGNAAEGLGSGGADAAMMFAADGADFVTKGPQPMMVGEQGPEHVSVTPLDGGSDLGDMLGQMSPEELDALLGGQTAGQENDILKQELQRSEQLMQPMNGQHTTGVGAGLGGIADAVRTARGANRENIARNRQRDVLTEEKVASKMYGEAAKRNSSTARKAAAEKAARDAKAQDFANQLGKSMQDASLYNFGGM